MILIDNGHGRDTPGKRSPDGLLQEWRYTRQLAQALHESLEAKSIPSVLLVPEEGDVPLRERVRRANAYGPDSLLISLHCNAAGNGSGWSTAQGWSAHVALNASSASKAFATELAGQARSLGLKVRQPMPKQLYWMQNLAICRDTRCPAVLTENLFMDNSADCAWLLSPASIETLAKLHAQAIQQFIKF